MRITRRDFLKATAAGTVLTGIGLPDLTLGAKKKTVRVGMDAPLTGPVSGWGLPGLYGCEIWIENVNAAGGIKVGDDHYLVEMVSFDNEYMVDKAMQGYKKLVMENEVKLVMMLGGETAQAVQGFANKAKMVTTTLLTSDLHPDYPYLIAPVETFPTHQIPATVWAMKNFSGVKTYALCAQQDTAGVVSNATYRALFELGGWEPAVENLFDVSTTDFAPIASSLLAAKPDIIVLDAMYPDFVNLFCEQVYHQGYKGKQMVSAFDTYKDVIDKTSKEFLEDFVQDFPDFDDSALNSPQINFKNPNQFYKEYNKRHPGTWGAVSWEYAAILEFWKSGVEKAGSLEPMDVFKALKAEKEVPHAFGRAVWWGKDFCGIDNAVVGDWPAVVCKNGKMKIVDFLYIPDWWDENKDVVIKHLEQENQMWYQRT